MHESSWSAKLEEVKIGDHGVTPTNPRNTFWVLIHIYFTFKNITIHETVASCPKNTVCERDQKPYFKSEHIYIRIKSFFKR